VRSMRVEVTEDDGSTTVWVVPKLDHLQVDMSREYTIDATLTPYPNRWDDSPVVTGQILTFVAVARAVNGSVVRMHNGPVQCFDLKP
jgi:hypothetical protein